MTFRIRHMRAVPLSALSRSSINKHIWFRATRAAGFISKKKKKFVRWADAFWPLSLYQVYFYRHYTHTHTLHTHMLSCSLSSLFVSHYKSHLFHQVMYIILSFICPTHGVLRNTLTGPECLHSVSSSLCLNLESHITHPYWKTEINISFSCVTWELPVGWKGFPVHLSVKPFFKIFFAVAAPASVW